MRRLFALRGESEGIGHRFAGPAVLIGSLLAIALVLYAIDMSAAGRLVF